LLEGDALVARLAALLIVPGSAVIRLVGQKVIGEKVIGVRAFFEAA
jgi:hypothetical protein